MNRIITGICLALLFYCQASFSKEYTKGYTEIEDLATLPILTPSLAEAKTAKIKLNNGLEAYLISDPHADQSGAALTVRAGSWDDPEAYPGIAHFLEHMLFLGTSKYPQESEYDRFIKEHGGSNNAFTSNDFTSYLFSINNNAFELALDRFSYFFKEPLFNPSGVARELQAIDQEYAQNVENDDVREIYVLKDLANPVHPYHRFNIGNTSTLSKVSQDTLKDWYGHHYSANLMRLVIISPQPLDKLIDLVVQDFKDVPNRDSKATDSTLPIFLNATSPQMTYIEPIKNVRSLMLVWDLPQPFAHTIETKPEALICYVLGHEGKESLLAQLKRENLAESLSCGSALLGPNNHDFYLNLELTDLGVHKVDTVIERIFQTLANLRQKGIPPYIFDEVQRMAAIKYQYQPRQDAFTTVMEHGMRLAHEEMKSYPLYTQVIQKFNPAEAQEFLNFLTPQNCHFVLMVPPSLTGINMDKKEPWIGGVYAVKPISKETIQTWSDAKPNINIDLPLPNPYIPTHLSLVNVFLKDKDPEVLNPKGTLVLDTPQAKVFFAADDRFQQPKIDWIFEIKTPEINLGKAESVVLTDLFIKNATEALSSISYPAQLAGLNFTIERKEYGIVITIEGYSQNAHLLFNQILKGFQSELSESNFKTYKSALLRQYQNFSKESPLRQASEMMKSLIYKNYTTEKEKAIAIKKITYARNSEFVKSFLNQNYVQGFLFGNMTEKQAKEVAQEIPLQIGGQPYPLKEQPKIEVIALPEQKGPFYIENKFKIQGNAALLAIEFIGFNFQRRAAQQILMQAMSEPFFAQLRTKQQTGYIVVSSGEEIEKELFNIFAVQSNTHEPRDLLARFELFIEGYLQELERELTEERFNNIKAALIETMSHPAKNIQEMGELLNRLAFKYTGDFEWMDKRIEGFKSLSYPQFLAFAKEFLGKSNKRRVGLLVHGLIPEGNQFSYLKLNNIEQLRNISDFYTSDQVK
jgi:insulysin